jgi:hypothetical protein
MIHEVVVFDPEGILPDGRVFQQDERLFEARRRGVVMLPVIPKQGPTSLGPFTKTFYGDGLPVSPIVPSYNGRAALWLERGRSSVAWAAMLRHGPELCQDGLLRLVGDPSQPPLTSAPVTDGAGNRSSVTKPTAHGSTWTILTGLVNCSTAAGAVFAFALHGYARDTRLAWLALSQTE